jgi:hypothetical protein
LNSIRLKFFLILAVAAALAACDSMSDRVRERFSSVPPKNQFFAGDESAVKAAVKLAFKRLEFVVNESGESGAQIEASGRIRHNESTGDSRQLVADVNLKDAGPGQVEVSILLSEEVEDPARAGSGVQALREHGFYDTFFDTVQQVLAEQAGTAPAK